MDRAVSDMLHKFIEVDEFTYFPIGDDLSFELFLVGTGGKKKKATIFLEVGHADAEIFVDTYLHDGGCWDGPTVADDDLYV